MKIAYRFSEVYMKNQNNKNIFVFFIPFLLVTFLFTVTYFIKNGNNDIRSRANEEQNVSVNLRTIGRTYPRMVGDVNGDGKADAVGFGKDAIYVGLSNGTKFAPITKWSTDLIHDWTIEFPRLVGDVNGDGKADVVGFGKDAIYVGLSDGTKFAPITKWSTDLIHDWTIEFPRLVGDVNGDGKADVVGFGKDAIYVGLSDGTKFAPITKWSTDFNPTHDWSLRYPRELGDVNGDGKADAVGFGKDAIYVGLSDGTKFAPITKWSTDLIHNWTIEYPRLVGDVNGDGKADAVGFGKDAVYVLLSTGASFSFSGKWSTDLNPSHNWSLRYPRVLGDINGDGKDDGVGFSKDAIKVILVNPEGTKFLPFQRWTTDFGPSKGWDV
jgi:hypothetical protein